MTNTVLVAGASGKTGRSLLPLLVGRGDNVLPAVRDADLKFKDALTVPFDWRGPQTSVDGVAALTTMSIDEDFMATVSGDVQAVAGREPTAFDGFARTATAAWHQ